MAEIQPIVMPKWGLAMQEGMLAAWHVAVGQEVKKGQEIADIETSKIANAFESPVSGPLRRRLVGEGETVAVGALLAVVADPSIADEVIEAFVADFQASFAASAAEAAASGPEPEFVEAGGRRLRYLKIGERRRNAGRLHPWLRRRSQQLAVQSAGPGGEPHHLRHRPARTWRLDQGGRRRATSAP